MYIFLISVIIPVYNVEQYLRQCLDSLLSQTYNDWECVIVDDGSTDNSGKICDEYAQKDQRIRVIHKSNEGLAKARQTGLENVSGVYVCTIDSDDWVDYNHIANYVRYIQETNADIITSSYYSNYEDEENLIESKPSAFDKMTLRCEVLEGKYHAGMWSKFIKRQLFKDNNISPAPYSYYEDMYTYLSCLEYAKKVVYNPIPTYHYRQSPVSMTNVKNIHKRIRMYEECMMNIEAICDKFEYLNDSMLRNAVYARVNHEKGRLLDYFLQYNIIRPHLLQHFKDSPSIVQVRNFRTWGIKHALYGNPIPFFLFKIYHRTLRIWKSC